MKAQFNLIKSANQNIKISFKILNSILNKKNYKSFSYNKELIFNYFISISDSQISVSLCPVIKSLSQFQKTVIGSFVIDCSTKFEASQVNIMCDDKILLDNIVLGFKQKDFIYSIYKKNSPKENFKTSYKLNKKNSEKLKSINFLKELVSEPSNIIYPDSFVKRTEKQINKSTVGIKTLDQKKLKKIGLNCLLAVSQGSVRQPRVMEFYKKNSSKNVDVLFVGKGVCFDSGGISIKPSAGMEEMKWDMGGAAVTAAIIKYLSEIKTNFSYAGIVGLVENMPSGTAYKPGDIIKSYKGINVEVLNTDAEGRLVLADIITYGCEIYKPKIVIDFATLTGAIMVALGQHYAGMFSNNDSLSDALYKSGIETNEKVWRMPLHDDFDKELNSPFVDLKNIGAGRYGGSVTAAQFLQRFVPTKTKWAHLDIAGTTWKNSGDILNSKGATGFGLTLIADFIDRYFKKLGAFRKMNRTFSIIKPDAVKRNLIGHINQIIENAGLKIVSSKKMYLTKQQAEIFYSVHKERPFFNSLVDYMTSGPVQVQVLDGNDAVSTYRKIMGATNPADAEEGTIRKLYAESIEANSVHGSDSDENAKIEIEFFFAGSELV